MVRTLTAHQLEVLGALVVTGSYKGAAHRLGISERAVRNSLSSTRRRMGGLTTLQVVHLLTLHGGLHDVPFVPLVS